MQSPFSASIETLCKVDTRLSGQHMIGDKLDCDTDGGEENSSILRRAGFTETIFHCEDESVKSFHTFEAWQDPPPYFVRVTAQDDTRVLITDSRLVLEKMCLSYSTEFELLCTHAFELPINRHQEQSAVSFKNIIWRYADQSETSQAHALVCFDGKHMSAMAQQDIILDNAVRRFRECCKEYAVPKLIKAGGDVFVNNHRFLFSLQEDESAHRLQYTSFSALFPKRIGIIGLGVMGSAIYTYLQERCSVACSGVVEVFGYDTSPNTSVQSSHESLEALINERLDVVILVLPDDDATKSVIDRLVAMDGAKDTLFVNTATISPGCSGYLYETVGAMRFCEAPMSGGPTGARAGTLTIMFSCSPCVFGRCFDVCRTFGGTAIYCGVPALASVYKLCNNFCVASNMLAFSIAARCCKLLGGDVAQLSWIVNSSTGRSWCTRYHNPVPGIVKNAPSTSNYQHGFRSSLMQKDLLLFSKSSQLNHPMIDLICDDYTRSARESPNLDFSVIYAHMVATQAKESERRSESCAFTQVSNIVLDGDSRGMKDLVRAGLIKDAGYEQASMFISSASRGPCIIATGSWIPDAKAPENDGIIGTVALANCLYELGFSPMVVTDALCHSAVERCCSAYPIMVFPELSEEESALFSRGVLSALKPVFLVSIERLARGYDGSYRNMSGSCVSRFTAAIDVLFNAAYKEGIKTIGLFDGGNEIGGGIIPRNHTIKSLTNTPSASVTSYAVVAATSTWAALGLVASVCIRTSRSDLLPTVSATLEWTDLLLKLGVVDGVTKRCATSTDGFDVSVTVQKLHNLYGLVNGLVNGTKRET